MGPFPHAFLLGLVAGAHCIGMCGGFAAGIGVGGRRGLLPRFALYIVGKLMTYMLLGVLVATLGASLLRDVELGHIQRWTAWLAGAAIVLSGLHLLGLLAPAARRLRIPGIDLFAELIGAATRSESRMAPAFVGMLTGFLPCGPVYGAVLFAASGGHALPAAGVMAAFGVGTAPALLLPAFAGGMFAAGKKRVLLTRIAGLLLIALGIMTALRGSEMMAAVMPACEHCVPA